MTDHPSADHTTEPVSAQAYLDVLMPLLAAVPTDNATAIGQAAELIDECLRDDGVVQAFGTGHSEALSMEVAGRAGGLVPTNRIALRDVVLFGGDSPDVLGKGTLERDPGLAGRLYELAAPWPQDVFVIASNSGVNGSIVEFATQVKAHGHKLIAITSLAHTSAVESRHPSGTKLIDHADVVLDNKAPYGDSVLDVPGVDAKVCAVSSITAALLAQLVTAEVVRRQVDAGLVPPVYISANVPEGDEHNDALEAKYAGRIRRGA